MPKLHRVSGHECIRALERMGFVQTRQRVSHVVLKNRLPMVKLVVSCHCIAKSRLELYAAY